MGEIIILDELTANKIAAGEVVQRPASVVKELVENSIDAGATSITVEIKRGGKSFIRVTDNGKGISSDDLVMAFEKHGTSKIKSSDDLEAIYTMGFRGEALASISAVARVEVTTKTKVSKIGTRAVIHGGDFIEQHECGSPVGTTFIVRDLFFNTPARYKFLKKDATEAGHIIDFIERVAISRPDISFRLINSGNETIRTPGNGDLKSAIFSIYGRDVVNNIRPIDYELDSIKVTGFAGNIETAISGRSRQSIFINDRYIKSRVISSAIDEAYKTLMMKGKYPFIVVKIYMDAHNVDVNVHPTKMEVRFSDESAIYRCIYHAVTNALFYREKVNNTYPFVEETSSSLVNDIKVIDNDNIQVEQNTSVDQNNILKSDLKTYEKETVGNISINEAKELNNNEKTSNEIDNKLEFKESEINESDRKLDKVVLENDVIDSRVPVSTHSSIGETLDIYQQSSLLENESFNEERDDDRLLLKEALFVGQAFNTFIILQYKDELVFIDQHAAHERVLFEELKKNVHKGNSISQLLISPVAIELTKSEFQTYQANKDLFLEMGFEIDEFGANSIIVRTIPSIIPNVEVKPLIIESLRNIMDSKMQNTTLTLEEELYVTACKAAVKANTKLDVSEVKELLYKMSHLDNPFTCPHGRPLIIKMTKKDLEKKFKRIV